MLLILLLLLVLAGACYLIFSYRLNEKKRREKKEVLRLIKKRHQLLRRLRRLVGNDLSAEQLLREEAERLNVATSSIRALKAALKRAAAASGLMHTSEA